MTLLVLESIFLGFAVFMLLSAIVLTFIHEKRKRSLEKWLLSAILLIKIAGIFFLLYWSISILLTFIIYVPGHNDYYSQFNRMFGPYWIWYWSTIIAYAMSQLFWFPFAQKTVFRILYSLFLLLVLSLEKITVFLTSLHRDFVPGGWKQVFTIEFFYSPWLMQLGIFAFFLLIIQLIRTNRKQETGNT